MVIIDRSLTAACPVGSAFFAPLESALAASLQQRSCPDLSDEHWLQIGTLRCLLHVQSGRDFLQRLASFHPDLCPERSQFFESLKSERRRSLCSEVNTHLCAHIARTLPDALTPLPGLDGWDIFAADGHFHGAAAHDPVVDGSKRAVGHLYTINLRTHAMRHLSASDQVERKKEHEMRTLKRLSIDALRQGAPTGRKVLYAYDPACIDLNQWQRWKQGSGIYFLTVTKANMVLSTQGHLPYQREDSINAGILEDRLVASGTNGHLLRQISFVDVCSGRRFEYLTNEFQMAPGVLAQIYKMRWDIEKVYDEVKNKLHEQKAWATSATAKSAQAEFICLAHNLLLLMEHRLESKEGITNNAEAQRRAKRLAQAEAQAAKQGSVLPEGLRRIQRHTQRSVKLVRWVAARMFSIIPWSIACAALAKLYAEL